MGSEYFLVLITLCSVICFNKNVKADCGGLIEAINGTITSPSFRRDPYTKHMECKWEIKMPSTYRIGLHFKEFYMWPPNPSCIYDSVTVKSKMEDGSVIEHGKFCGEESVPNIYSDSNILLINFKYDRGSIYNGFELEFFSDACGGLIDGGTGHISSPFFPDLYTSNKICEWIFKAPPQHKIKLHFLKFETEEGGDECSNDFLLVQRKTTDGEIYEYGKYCGNRGPSLIQSKDNLFVTFVSDCTFQKSGFKAEYAIDKLTNYELSTSLMRSTSSAYVPFTSATVGYNDEKNAFLRNETNTLSKKFESSFLQSVSSTTSAYGPNDPTTDNQQSETENWIALRNETNILSDDLKLLSEKVISLEDNLKKILAINENLLKNCGK